MPTYSFMNKETEEIEEIFMSFSQREEYLKNNPHMEQVILQAPAIGDSARLGIRRTDDNFNSLLKHIKKGNEKGFTKSTIKTR